MTRGALRDRVDRRGRQIPAPSPIARPGASGAVEPGRPNGVFGSPARVVNGRTKPADRPQTVWIHRSEQKKTAQDAPGSTIDTPARVQHPPFSARSRATAKTAVEMTSLWKPQNGFHRDLEISPRTRDSHIPTAESLWRKNKNKDQEKRLQ